MICVIQVILNFVTVFVRLLSNVTMPVLPVIFFIPSIFFFLIFAQLLCLLYLQVDNYYEQEVSQLVYEKCVVYNYSIRCNLTAMYGLLRNTCAFGDHFLLR